MLSGIEKTPKTKNKTQTVGKMGQSKMPVFHDIMLLFVLFVCLRFLHPTRSSFSHMERLPLPVEGFNFWLILDIHDHWTVRDFSVLNVLWHGASVYNGHLRETMTLTTVAERLEKELSLPIFTKYVCSDRDSNIQPSAIKANALIDCTTEVVRMLLNTLYVLLFSFYVFS